MAHHHHTVAKHEAVRCLVRWRRLNLMTSRSLVHSTFVRDERTYVVESTRYGLRFNGPRRSLAIYTEVPLRTFLLSEMYP